jgi:hypothetical protein
MSYNYVDCDHEQVCTWAIGGVQKDGPWKSTFRPWTRNEETWKLIVQIRPFGNQNNVVYL